MKVLLIVDNQGNSLNRLYEPIIWQDILAFRLQYGYEDVTVVEFSQLREEIQRQGHGNVAPIDEQKGNDDMELSPIDAIDGKQFEYMAFVGHGLAGEFGYAANSEQLQGFVSSLFQHESFDYSSLRTVSLRCCQGLNVPLGSSSLHEAVFRGIQTSAPDLMEIDVIGYQRDVVAYQSNIALLDFKNPYSVAASLPGLDDLHVPPSSYSFEQIVRNPTLSQQCEDLDTLLMVYTELRRNDSFDASIKYQEDAQFILAKRIQAFISPAYFENLYHEIPIPRDDLAARRRFKEEYLNVINIFINHIESSNAVILDDIINVYRENMFLREEYGIALPKKAPGYFPLEGYLEDGRLLDDAQRIEMLEETSIGAPYKHICSLGEEYAPFDIITPANVDEQYLNVHQIELFMEYAASNYINAVSSLEAYKIDSTNELIDNLAVIIAIKLAALEPPAQNDDDYMEQEIDEREKSFYESLREEISFLKSSLNSKEILSKRPFLLNRNFSMEDLKDIISIEPPKVIQIGLLLNDQDEWLRNMNRKSTNPLEEINLLIDAYKKMDDASIQDTNIEDHINFCIKNTLAMFADNLGDTDRLLSRIRRELDNIADPPVRNFLIKTISNTEFPAFIKIITVIDHIDLIENMELKKELTGQIYNDICLRFNSLTDIAEQMLEQQKILEIHPEPMSVKRIKSFININKPDSDQMSAYLQENPLTQEQWGAIRENHLDSMENYINGIPSIEQPDELIEAIKSAMDTSLRNDCNIM